MPTLYRRPKSPLGDEVQEALEEIVIQHDVVVVDAEVELPHVDSVSLQDLPALMDDGAVYTGRETLERHVETLRELMGGWDQFQSDTCEIDEEGRMCGHESVRNEDGPGMSMNPALRAG